MLHNYRRAIQVYFKISQYALDQMEEAGEGVCISCGERVVGIHPEDANLMCGNCGCQTVYGPNTLREAGAVEATHYET